MDLNLHDFYRNMIPAVPRCTLRSQSEEEIKTNESSNKLQQMEIWIEGYLAAAEKKYANISSKDPENLSLRIIKGEIIAIKRILQEFTKDKTAL